MVAEAAGGCQPSAAIQHGRIGPSLGCFCPKASNLDKDVIFLHVVEIKMMLQLLGCKRCFWIPVCETQTAIV